MVVKISKINLTDNWQVVATGTIQIQNKSSGSVLIGQGVSAPVNDGDAMVLSPGELPAPFSPAAGESVFAKMGTRDTGSIVVLGFQV